MSWLWQAGIPTALGVAAWIWLPTTTWLQLSAKLVPVLSIFGAAILFRLGRGLPEFGPKDLSITEADRLAEMARNLAQRTAVMLVFVTVALIVSVVASTPGLVPCEPGAYVGRIVTAIGVLLTSFAFIRTIHLVRGDIGLVRLQGDLMREAARRRLAREQAKKRRQAKSDKPLQQPSGYGGLASHEETN
ncbi:MAG: hypothetical protein OXP36_12610 [Gammaproteobacteria bacterium]|nr:hypothetical protein [Gammaproteobacteria bacterium]